MLELLAALTLLASTTPSPAAAKVDSGAPPEATPEQTTDRRVEKTRPERTAAREPLPPEITADGLRDELRRAARERKAQAAKMNDEHSKLGEERTQLEQMAHDIESARQSLRTETDDLRQQLKKKPSAAPAGPAAAVDGAGSGKPPPGPIDLVAKTLKNMRPDQAAQILIHVDRALAVSVLAHMRASDAGAVLEKMKPDQAAQFVTALAGEGRAGEGHGGEQRHE
jgi:flagellar motility protein MotE (MotC chaperone)